MGFFNIEKNGNSNNNQNSQRFINSNMNDMPINNDMNNMASNSETFVYNSIPKQDMYSPDGFNQNMMNNQNYNNMGYNNQMMNQQPAVVEQQLMSNQMMQQPSYDNYVMNDNQIVNQTSNDSGMMSNQMSQPNISEMNTNMSYMNNVEQAVDNNSSLVPRGVQANVVPQPEIVDELDIMEDTPEPVALDPLNNSNNPIPVNPVAPKVEVIEEELPQNVKANAFSVIGMMMGMILKPGTTVIKNSKKYRSINKALVVTLWIGIFSILLCMVGRMAVGCFSVTHNAVTGASSVSLSFTGLFDLNNYIPYIITSVVMSYGTIGIASMVYYASSFLNSKGIPMGSYFMVSSLAMIPLIVGTLVLYPIANVFSTYVALLIFVFSFIYTLIAFFIGMNEILKFDNIDSRILYNVINLSIIFVIVVAVFMLLFRLNVLIPPELYL